MLFGTNICVVGAVLSASSIRMVALSCSESQCEASTARQHANYARSVAAATQQAPGALELQQHANAVIHLKLCGDNLTSPAAPLNTGCKLR
jgi:hypothetical protein